MNGQRGADVIWAEVSRGFDGGVVPTSASRGALKMPLDMKEETERETTCRSPRLTAFQRWLGRSESKCNCGDERGRSGRGRCESGGERIERGVG